MNWNKIYVFAAVTVLVVGFQNCSNTTSFDAAGSLVAKTGADDSVTDDTGSSDDSSNIDDSNDDVADGGGNSGGVMPPPSLNDGQNPSYPPVVDRDRNDRDHRDNGSSHDGSSRDDRECADRGNSEDRRHDGSQSGLVACILEGPGSSVKVALSQAGLAGEHSVSKSICMSRNACLGIVSKILPVKSAEKRGYCGHNPNVVSMTDAEIEAAVNQELLSKMVSSR